MKNYLNIAVIGIICFLLTGCWDKVEMEDRSYVITLGIDKYEEGESSQVDGVSNNRYALSLGTAELSEISEQNKGSENDEKKAVQIAGESIASAIKAADMFSSRQIYMGQLKTVIFGEEILKDKEAFKEALEALERNQEISTKTILLSTEGKAVDCVNAILGENASSGLFIWDFYKNSAENVATTGRLDLENALVDLRGSGNTIIPRIEVENKKIKLGGGSIISNYTLQGHLKDLEERGYLWLRGRAEGAVVDAIADNKVIPMWVLNNKCKYSFREENGKVICTISVEVKGSIEGSSTGTESLLNENHIDELAKIFEKTIQSEVENVIELMQSQYDADGIQLIDEMKKRANKLYKAQNKSDKELFEQMEFEPVITVHIPSIGVIE